MNISSQDDFYIRLKSDKGQKRKTQFSTTLTTPLSLPYNHRLKVGLSSIHFVNNTNETNVKGAKFEIAISRFTKPVTNPPLSDSSRPEPEIPEIINSQSLSQKKRRLSLDSSDSPACKYTHIDLSGISRDTPIHADFFLTTVSSSA